MTAQSVTVTVTGAAGQIAYALLFRIASGQMFGPETQVNLQLLELEQALPALEGVCMELDDCAFPSLGNIVMTSDLKQAMSDTNWALLVGSVPRKAGMERGDLLKVNGNIFKPQGQAINDYAADDVRTLVVGNPCNTNCLIAMRNAPDIEDRRFFAMTLLDENRARTQLAKKAGVAVSAVRNMTIWGNHSATQYPDFYHAEVGDKPAHEVIGDEQWLQNTFMQTVQQRGAAVIKARGASSAASAANAVVGSVQQLLRATPVNDSYSIAQCSRGEYDVEPGLIFSFPTRTVGGIAQIVTDWQHNDYAAAKLRNTEQELKDERDQVRALGLID